MKKNKDRQDGLQQALVCGAQPSASTTNKAPANMGESVTPHVGISLEAKFLVCGIDTLDLSACVDWGQKAYDFLDTLENGRKQSQDEDRPVLWNQEVLEACVIYPTGKTRYRYHIEMPEVHIFISRTDKSDKFPNVYISLKSKTLWSLGIDKSVTLIIDYIESLGGIFNNLKPSRCDLCTDFYIPDGLSFDFLRDYGVPSDIKVCPIMQGNKLETYYVGSMKGAIRLRIYDKAKEVLKRNKIWFLEIWNVTECKDIWRFEFQMRRQTLKAYGVNTADELKSKVAGIWNDLTNNWYSLRLQDNANTSRRSFHPLWLDIQDCDECFGPLIEAQRLLSPGNKATHEYYEVRGANCMLAHAAILGISKLENAVSEFSKRILNYWRIRDFCDARLTKTVELGKVFERTGVYEDEVPF